MPTFSEAFFSNSFSSLQLFFLNILKYKLMQKCILGGTTGYVNVLESIRNLMAWVNKVTMGSKRCSYHLWSTQNLLLCSASLSRGCFLLLFWREKDMFLYHLCLLLKMNLAKAHWYVLELTITHSLIKAQYAIPLRRAVICSRNTDERPPCLQKKHQFVHPVDEQLQLVIKTHSL